jgi:putative membrane protein
MAGMLYLPRLFVYHTQAKIGSDSYAMLLTMEKKLLRIIMMPAMTVVFITGFMLFFAYGGFAGPKFLHIKLLLAFVMAGFHGFFANCHGKFANNSNTKSKKFFLIINEVPAILLLIIVFVIVMKI